MKSTIKNMGTAALATNRTIRRQIKSMMKQTYQWCPMYPPENILREADQGGKPSLSSQSSFIVHYVNACFSFFSQICLVGCAAPITAESTQQI